MDKNKTTMHGARSIHKEIILQEHLVAQFVAGQGYKERTPDDYDRELALDRELASRFVKATQPVAVGELEGERYGAVAVYERISRHLDWIRQVAFAEPD